MQPDQWLDSVNLAALRRAILRWYDARGRDLPWRQTTDPYRVWVSEVMLQQTQVTTVLPYYGRFLRRFPTVRRLAAAELADVLRLWQGLGYYRRARDLYAAARQVVADHGGVVPADPTLLARLPGLGRYTANAIACFSTGARLPILEANTIRLWTRVTAAAGDPRRTPLKEQLWRLAEQVVPTDRAADFNQALMDLGAGVCTSRAPACSRCPMKTTCRARADDAVERFPQLGARPEPVNVEHVTVIARRGNQLLVTERPPQGRWAGLWEFPRVERRPRESPLAAARRALQSAAPDAVGPLCEWKSLRHGIMHYRVLLRCFVVELPANETRACQPPKPGPPRPRPRRSSRSQPPPPRSARGGDPRVQWVDFSELDRLAFSSPQRRLARAYLDENALP